MLKKLTVFIGIVVLCMVGSLVIHTDKVDAAPKTYSIKPSSKPINKTYLKYKSYNNQTKHYYLLQSYMEAIEKNGGGTLVLKKGTYTISNAIYVPSNTTIKLQNGVTLKKGKTTGKATFKPSATFIQLVTPKKSLSKSSISAYRGAKNVKILGYGNATINLNNASKSPAIVAAHANNLTISGIQFKNANAATTMHIIGSKKVSIKNNKFLHAKKGTILPSIRIESARKAPAIYPLTWSKNDGTVSNGISITGNTFQSQYTAIQTSDYVKGKYQTNLMISKNKFSKMTGPSIYSTAWTKPKIIGNTFNDTSSKSTETILLRATKFPTIQTNSFIKSKEIVDFKKLYVKGKLISDATNTFSATNKKALEKNTATSVKNFVILLPNDDFVELIDKNLGKITTYTFNSKTKPLNSAYERYSSYNTTTKPYYVLRSILERLEMQGGGTLIIKKGTYSIANNLYVPSNVTIELENGAVLKKIDKTNTSKLTASKSIFQLVPPKIAENNQKVKGGYTGTKNVKIYSTGRATIDLQNIQKSFAIVMGHNQNVTIENIDFVNMNGGHFIELDASKDVRITNSTFKENSVKNFDNAHEAINLDTPDKITQGFNSPWSNFDRTANQNVTIEHSTFENMVTAIGTHQYSGKGVIDGVSYESKMHKNVQIKNNVFKNLTSAAVHAMNWDRPVISNNEFIHVGNVKGEAAVISNGSLYPTFSENDFTDLGQAMLFTPRNNATNGKEYERIYDVLNKTNLKALETNRGTNLSDYTIRVVGENKTDIVNIIED